MLKRTPSSSRRDAGQPGRSLEDLIRQRLPSLDVLERFEQLSATIASISSLHLYTDCPIRFDWNYGASDEFAVFTARNSRIALYVTLDPHTYFAIPIAGALTATYDDRRSVVTAGKSVLISRYAPARLDLSEGLDCVYVKVRTDLLRRWIAESEHARLASEQLGEVIALDEPGVGAFANFVTRLGADLDANGGFGGLDRRRELEEMFRSSFLDGPVAALDRIRARQSEAPARTVRAAVAFMQANIGRKITIAELDQACGVGERSIQAAFNKQFGYSPWSHLRNLRLERARTQLADPACRLSVAEIAGECGFNHFGQFARDYREYFGDTPKRTSLVSRIAGNRWRATLQLAARSARPVKRYLERLLAG